MKKEELHYKLTGTETPVYLTTREKVMIDKFLKIIKETEQGNSELLAQRDELMEQNEHIIHLLKRFVLHSKSIAKYNYEVQVTPHLVTAAEAAIERAEPKDLPSLTPIEDSMQVVVDKYKKLGGTITDYLDGREESK